MSASLYFRNSVRQISVDGELNMANANARTFLAALGLSTDFENDPPMDAGEFLATLRLFINSDIGEYVDRGRPTTMDQSHGCLMIECGLDAGYIRRRVECAIQLTEEALSKGATECYFC